MFVGSTDGTVSDFPIACGSGGRVCEPSWSIERLGRLPNPTVVNGVLFVGSTWAVNELFAYDADCGAAGGACEPLWHFVSTDLGSFQQPQALADDGTLIAVTGIRSGEVRTGRVTSSTVSGCLRPSSDRRCAWREGALRAAILPG